MAQTARTDFPDRADWSLIPEHMRGGVERWVMNGIVPGLFLTAVLRNDLKEAFATADDINSRRMRDYVQFFWSHAPSACWGSPDAVSEWTQRGGLTGRDRDRDAAEDAA